MRDETTEQGETADPMSSAARALAALPRLQLARVPTPLEEAPRLLAAIVERGADRAGLPQLFVKRDDLTGLELSGNKVRKLELLLAEAVAQGADTVVTCGGVQSNHCRATALAAARIGLRSIVLLRVADPAAPQALEGNLLLDRLAGAEVRFISRADYARRAEVLAATASELAARGRRAYLIPEGGSNALGSLGYVACIDELRQQVPQPERPLTVVYAAGSGGTGAGLLYGAALRGLPWRIVGVNVCDDRDYFVRRISEILAEIGSRLGPLAIAEATRAIDIRDGYVGRGYALSRPEELRLIARAAAATGLLLDPVYTGKALFGLAAELARADHGLGERVVFLHSGGVFGLLAAGPGFGPVLGGDDADGRGHA